MDARAHENKRIQKPTTLSKRIMSESFTASLRTAVALESTELDRVSEEGDNICCPSFFVLYFYLHTACGPGISSQDRKNKQACESNLACFLKAGGARARRKNKREKTSKLLILHPTN